jgi:hypothetical protein
MVYLLMLSLLKCKENKDGNSYELLINIVEECSEINLRMMMNSGFNSVMLTLVWVLKLKSLTQVVYDNGYLQIHGSLKSLTFICK